MLTSWMMEGCLAFLINFTRILAAQYKSKPAYDIRILDVVCHNPHRKFISRKYDRVLVARYKVGILDVCR